MIMSPLYCLKHSFWSKLTVVIDKNILIKEKLQGSKKEKSRF